MGKSWTVPLMHHLLASKNMPLISLGRIRWKTLYPQPPTWF